MSNGGVHRADSCTPYRASAIARYGSVIVVLIVAAAIGDQAAESWHLKISFVTIYLALVVVAAWIGGLGPGVLTTLACALMAAYFWSEPVRAFAVASRHDIVSLGLFVLLGGLTSLICEQLHAARRREHRQRLLREEMLALVAHELKNPLNALHLALSLLRLEAPSGPEGDKLRVLVDRMRRLTGGMEHIVRDLLDAAAIEAGAFSIVKAPEQLDGLLTEVVESHLDAARRKGVSLDAIASCPCPPVLCDRARVIQALSNLVGNALKFTPQGGSVHVRADAVDGEVQLSVIDTGPGVPADVLDNLFERYRHGEQRSGSETGLGLYIAQGIIRAHGGRPIVVASRPGRGSTFMFGLPPATGPRAVR